MAVLGLGFFPDQPLAAVWPQPGWVFVAAPHALLHAKASRPGGGALFDLLTCHPARQPGDLVFVSDLAAELAQAGLTWQAVGIDWEGVTDAVALLHRRGAVRAAPVGRLTAAEVALLAGSPQLPAAPVREARSRLTAQLATLPARPLRPRQRDYGGHRSRPTP